MEQRFEFFDLLTQLVNPELLLTYDHVAIVDHFAEVKLLSVDEVEDALILAAKCVDLVFKRADNSGVLATVISWRLIRSLALAHGLLIDRLEKRDQRRSASLRSDLAAFVDGECALFLQCNVGVLSILRRALFGDVIVPQLDHVLALIIRVAVI